MARQRILEAASEMACNEGANSLSLERVAERAGVSKGGLLYHFHTKEALLLGMMEEQLGCRNREIKRCTDSGMSVPEAVIELSLGKFDTHDNLAGCFMASIVSDGDARELIAEHRKSWHQDLLNAGMAPHRAMIFGLVLDGLFAGSGLGVTQPTKSDLELIRQGLLELTQPSEEAILAEMFRAALDELDVEAVA